MEVVQSHNPEEQPLYAKPKYTVEEILNDGGVMSEIFPNYKQRDEQIRLSKAIMDTIEEAGDLISEASTGTGKSVAYLVPAILKPDWKFVVSTATKALQEQLYYKDIPLLKEVFSKVGIRFDATLLKGRGNYISIRRFVEYSKNIDYTYFEQHQKVSDWWQNSNGDFDDLDFVLDGKYRSEINSTSDDCEGRKCPFYEQCKFHNIKKKASMSKIIVVNHDLLATDLVLKQRLGFGTLPNYDGIILDEAHNFEDVITKYLGFRLSRHVINGLKASVNKLFKEEQKENDIDEEFIKEVGSLLNKSVKFADKFFDLFYPNSGEVMRIKPVHIDTSAVLYSRKLTHTLGQVYKKLESIKYYGEKSEEFLSLVESKIRDISDRVGQIMDIESLYDEIVFWSTVGAKEHVFVESAPIDVSPHLSSMLFERDSLEDIYTYEKEMDVRVLKTVILTSATIATNGSFYYIKERLGIGESNECVVGSPFNYKKQSLFYIPKNIVEPVGNKENLDAFTRLTAQNVIELVNASDGRALVLFTSYSEMQKVYDLCYSKIKHTVYKQGDYPKNILTEKFTNEINSVLFATSSYREGVSIEGESLSLVIMDRLPFPVPSEPIIEARIDKMKQDGFDWFNGYYIPIAIIALKQGFGRLIRTVDDFGCFALMDKRVVTKNYGYKFINSLPDMLETRKIEKVNTYYDIVEKIRDIRRQKGRRV